MKRRPSPPPWTRPGRLLWLALALAASGWLILHMPASRTARPAASPAVTQAPETEAPSLRIPAASHAVTEAPGHALRPLPDSGAGSHAATSPAAPQTPRAQVPAASLDVPGNPRSEAARQAVAGAQTPPAEAPRRMKQAPLSPGGKLLAKAETFGRLFALVGIAAFLGGLMEARRWHMALARVMGKLTRMARLPEIVGLAMPTALCSNAAANSMLVSSHAEGHIRTSALIAGGMANSYLAYVSHSIRVMYPVIGAVGLSGAVYFGVQFLGGFLVICGVLLWNRWYVSGHAAPFSTPEALPSVQADPLPWPGAAKLAALRACTLLFRMACITIPLMLGIEYLLKSGALSAFDNPFPVASVFPAELLSVVAAQMGGLVQSSAVAANLRAEGLISDAQIVLAMLVGSAVGNPFRTLRRNLPTALGIFPVRVALVIVLGMQFARFAVTLVAIAGVVGYLWMP